MLQIRDARLPDDLNAIEKLWVEYLTWGNNKMQSVYGVHPHDPHEAVAKDITSIQKFLPPYGRLLLAFVDNKACGIGCLKRINDEIGEIKRMYVDPSFRNVGAGRAILQSLISSAKNSGYHKLRLDSPKFMEAAHSLYRKAGFEEIEAYPEMEIPATFIDYMLFMELDLTKTEVSG